MQKDASRSLQDRSLKERSVERAVEYLTQSYEYVSSVERKTLHSSKKRLTHV